MGACRRRGPDDQGHLSPLAGFTVPYVLLLLRSNGEMHGYALREELESRGLLTEVDCGNLYRTLRRMEESGLVTSRWEMDASGPGRRRYAITAVGVAALATAETALRRARAGLDLFFDIYRDASAAPLSVAETPSQRLEGGLT